jgi:RNA polymerase sigma factor (sigma-70 family)
VTNAASGHIRGVSPSHAQRMARDRSFERLYRRHRRDVYGAVLRDVRDPAEAEDVTQIAFLNAFRAIRRGEEPEKPRAWLVTIARNVVRRRYKAQAARVQEVALDPELAADLSDLEGPTAGEIATAIRRLPPNQRAVILLREIQGRSYAEIAEELELSLAAVETLIFRARRSLSERLKLIDQVPTTQEKSPRRLGGFLALPLPGLGKLSFGFSAGRTAMAALVGGVAIVTVPVADVAADQPHPAIVQRAPSAAERVGPPVTTLRSTETNPARTRAAGDKRDARRSDKEAPADSGGGTQDLLPSVDVLPSVDPLPSVPVPTIEVPTLPPLPVEPPALPPLPPPPDTDLLG